MVMNPTAAEVRSVMSIFLMFPSMSTPTYTSAGDVAQAGMTDASGVRNRQMKKQQATVPDVRPVRPPADTPVADSTKVVQVEVPSIPPTTVAVESAIMHLSRLRGSPFSSSMSASEAVP